MQNNTAKHIGEVNSEIRNRFFKSFEKKENGCWEWKKNKTKRGYGVFEKGNPKNRIRFAAHRLSWAIHNNGVPADILVCHHCDNPPCVNPSHLFLGTVSDNAKDMVKKGRCSFQTQVIPRPRGEKQHLAKLTWETVNEIRRLYIPRKFPLQRLSKMFGVSIATIHHVVMHDTWVKE